jgi:hypothetical protein
MRRYVTRILSHPPFVLASIVTNNTVPYAATRRHVPRIQRIHFSPDLDDCSQTFTAHEQRYFLIELGNLMLFNFHVTLDAGLLCHRTNMWLSRVSGKLGQLGVRFMNCLLLDILSRRLALVIFVGIIWHKFAPIRRRRFAIEHSHFPKPILWDAQADRKVDKNPVEWVRLLTGEIESHHFSNRARRFSLCLVVTLQSSPLQPRPNYLSFRMCLRERSGPH